MSRKEPWSNPQASKDALVRWSQPVGADVANVGAPLSALARGFAVDAALLAAHVVRPMEAGTIVVEMRTAIMNVSTGTGTYAYQNVSYGLCRILLPILDGTLSRDRAFGSMPAYDASDAPWDGIAIQACVRRVQAAVLDPAGASAATTAPVSGDALALPLPVTAGGGWESDEPRTLWYKTGTAGWHFTPHELLELMATFRREGTILGEADAWRMLEDGIGVEPPMRAPGGIVATKDGYWETGRDASRPSRAPCPATRSSWSSSTRGSRRAPAPGARRRPCDAGVSVGGEAVETGHPSSEARCRWNLRSRPGAVRTSR